jgi:hypothetical protein
MESSQMKPVQKSGIRQRVSGVINRLIQRSLLNYLALVVVVGIATFLVLHYYTELFKNEDGKKIVLHQAIAAAGVAVIAAVAAFFARLL